MTCEDADMDDYTLLATLLTGVFVVVFLVGTVLFYARLFQTVEPGRVLIVNQLSRIVVYFTGGFVMPVVHRAVTMDIGMKTIELERRGSRGVICQDHIRADLKMSFFLRVNTTADDVVRVAQRIGAERASDPQALEELFSAKFGDAIEQVAAHLDFADLYAQRQEFQDQIIETVGRDLDGYVLDDLAIDFLEQTPIGQLDPNNILDAKGIRKITEVCAEQQRLVDQSKHESAKRLAQLGAEAKMLLTELERQQADALARLRADTGRDLSPEQLEDRLAQRLRAMVEEVVAERRGGGEA